MSKYKYYMKYWHVTVFNGIWNSHHKISKIISSFRLFVKLSSKEFISET